LRGISIIPEVDGPAHAPTLANTRYGYSVDLTIDGGVEQSTPTYAVEPPNGVWNLAKNAQSATTQVIRDTFSQLYDDFDTAPFLHIGGDEPVAASFCAQFNEPLRAGCLKECASVEQSWQAPATCKVTPYRPPTATANETWWFPDHINPLAQAYFDSVTPPLKGDLCGYYPRTGAWSGAYTDLAVRLPRTPQGGNTLQLWEWSTPEKETHKELLEQACAAGYDLVQSSATYPNPKDGVAAAGWNYLECGYGGNWISMTPDYWCPRANWVALYSLGTTQAAPAACASSFVGGEVALWGEISGPGSVMAQVFPRTAAYAERLWANPPALTSEQVYEPPRDYWSAHLKGALRRLNAIVDNLSMQGQGVSMLQPQFCLDHPKYCEAYTEVFV